MALRFIQSSLRHCLMGSEIFPLLKYCTHLKIANRESHIVKYAFHWDKELILVKIKIFYQRIMNYVMSTFNALVLKCLSNPNSTDSKLVSALYIMRHIMGTFEGQGVEQKVLS